MPATSAPTRKHMSAEPHQAGSPQSKAVANYILGLLKEWGLDAHIENVRSTVALPDCAHARDGVALAFHCAASGTGHPGDPR